MISCALRLGRPGGKEAASCIGNAGKELQRWVGGGFAVAAGWRTLRRTSPQTERAVENHAGDGHRPGDVSAGGGGGGDMVMGDEALSNGGARIRGSATRLCEARAP